MFDKAKVVIDLEEYLELTKEKEEISSINFLSEKELILKDALIMAIIDSRYKTFSDTVNIEESIKKVLSIMGWKLEIEKDTTGKELRSIKMILEKVK